MRKRFTTPALALTFLLIGTLIISLLPRAATAQGQQGQDKSKHVNKSGLTQPSDEMLDSADAAQSAQAGSELSESVKQQILAIQAEKLSRTTAQRKIDSQLLYAVKMERGEAIADSVPTLEVGVKTNSGMTLVDIKANVTDALLATIKSLGGQVMSVHKKYNTLRANIPLRSIEKLAALKDIKNIRPADEAETSRIDPSEMVFGDSASPAMSISPALRSKVRPGFAERADNLRTQLGNTLSTAASGGGQTDVGALTSQGDATHRATDARTNFGVTGAGIKIGVLSDGVTSLATSRASGDVGPVIVLPGQAGSGDEGTAMLEIVHDLAPGAQLYFATAFGGVAGFAQNIRDLRAAGCDIIVDDVSYFNESPFQDGPIAQAVNDVTASGALYFASAGNAGNLDDNTSGVWEGDFVDGGTAFSIAGGTFHDFDPSATVTIQNRTTRTTTSARPGTLFWSDPLGASANDYDLYVINTAGTAIETASTNVQDGDDDPYEQLTIAANSNGRRVCIFKKTSAAARFLHVNVNRQRFATSGAVLGFGTTGQIRTHCAAVNAFAVAATPANTPFGAGQPTGPFPLPFNSTNLSETFTSDGPRRVIYQADGTPYTPGNVSSTGGVVRQKPDITAADGVSTTAPGFNPFFGTSASAPHAAAIAALVKSANRSLTTAQIRTALTSTAIDIETAGVDRDTGNGIVMAFEAVNALASRPDAFQPYIDFDSQTATPASGDGDAYLEPGETGTVNVRLTNDGAATATNINSTLTTSTPNVLITQGASAYPNLASLASANNTTPFTFRILPGAACFQNINFTLTVTDSGPNSPRVFNFSVPTGQPAATSTTVSYAGAPVNIPDADETGITATINVTGFSGAIADLNFRFDGSSCSTDAESTTVGLNHSFVGDLVITLKSPQGTTITLRNSDANSGHNFCQTTLDDSAATSIQAAPSTSQPFTGSFKPAQALSTFNGENPNGAWTLQIADVGATDIGTLRAFSLVLTSFQCDFRLPPRVSDFTGDGQADFSVFRPSDGNWLTLNADSSVTVRQWGTSTDKPVPGDYDADGKTDYAVFRPSEGNWYVIRSSTNTAFVQGWGNTTDIPVPADYDNDGKTDVAVFRPSEGNWYVLKSTGGVTVQGWGAAGDLPVQADYDGDRKADLAVFRPSEGNWYVLKSTGGSTVQTWGDATDRLVPGDYDGDGKNDLAVFRPSEGNWYIRNSSGGTTVKGWGNSSDVLVPADYDNDGKTDIAVWRPSEANWYVVKSTGGALTQYFGGVGDKPIPSVYLPQ